MRYYVSQDKKSKPPKGRFSIKGISISMAETETKNFANCFQANTPNRIYYMYSEFFIFVPNFSILILITIQVC